LRPFSLSNQLVNYFSQIKHPLNEYFSLMMFRGITLLFHLIIQK